MNTEKLNKLKVERKTWSVIKYTDIPSDIREIEEDHFSGQSNDCFIEYKVFSRTEQSKYNDDFSLDNWIIRNFPELEGRTILIEIDY